MEDKYIISLTFLQRIILLLPRIYGRPWIKTNYCAYDIIYDIVIARIILLYSIKKESTLQSAHFN